jgi:hypothetical protein
VVFDGHGTSREMKSKTVVFDTWTRHPKIIEYGFKFVWREHC